MKRLYTYALVNSLYNENKDYIDCFIPFVAAVCSEEMLNIKTIQEKINEKYGILIPQHTLLTIAKRARKEDILEGDRQQCKLTSEGRKLNEKISSERETEREAKELIESFARFCKDDRNKDVQVQEAEKCVYSYIHDRLESLRYFLKDNKALSSETEAEGQNALFKDFSAFVERIERSNSRLFKILSNIVYGTVISLAIGGIDIPEIDQKFQSTTLFLDTNVIFDLLGFQGDDAMRVTKEFFTLTKQNSSFVFYVLDMTVDEVCRVLEAYPVESHRYLPEIEVDSIYYHLKKKGWNRVHVAQFIADVDSTLRDLGIKIYDTRRIDYSELDLEDKKTVLKRYKPIQGAKGLEHDLKTIWAVKELRKDPCRRIQTAKFFFLSQDMKLARFNYNEQGHRDTQTIPEVLTERTLTNLLWLREPKQIPLSSLIVFHKEHAIVTKNVWEKFQDILSEACTKDLSMLEDATILLCYKRLQGALVEFEDDTPKSDIVNAIKTRADALRKENEIQHRESLAKQEELYRKELREIVEAASKEKDSATAAARVKELDKVRQYTKTLRENAFTAADRYFEWGCWIFGILECLVLFYLLYARIIQSYWSLIEPIAWTIGIGLGALLAICKYDIHQLRSKLKDWIRNCVYRIRRDKANIPELLKTLGIEDEKIQE